MKKIMLTTLASLIFFSIGSGCTDETAAQIKTTEAPRDLTNPVSTTDSITPYLSFKDCPARCDAVYVAVDTRAGPIYSEALQFNTPGTDIVPLKSENPGEWVGPVGDRDLIGWRIGDRYESSTETYLEVIQVGDNVGIIAHQLTGFDHLKRSHMVFEVTPAGLETRLDITEGAGPHYNILYPSKDGIHVIEEFMGAGSESRTERFFTWRKVKPSHHVLLPET